MSMARTSFSTFHREEGRVLVHQVIRLSGLPFREFLLYFGRSNQSQTSEDIHQTSFIGEAAMHSPCTVFPFVSIPERRQPTWRQKKVNFLCSLFAFSSPGSQASFTLPKRWANGAFLYSANVPQLLGSKSSGHCLAQRITPHVQIFK